MGYTVFYILVFWVQYQIHALSFCQPTVAKIHCRVCVEIGLKILHFFSSILQIVAHSNFCTYVLGNKEICTYIPTVILLASWYNLLTLHVGFAPLKISTTLLCSRTQIVWWEVKAIFSLTLKSPKYEIGKSCPSCDLQFDF